MIRNFLIGFRRGFKDYGDIIMTFFNTILLFLVYIIGVGMSKLISIIMRKKFLDIEQNNEKTYWKDYNEINDEYRQF